jgi:lantibiotic modifying enzyme
MTTTELSPSAQAILDAWENEWSKASLCHDQHSIAAVLRAAADQLDHPTSAHTLYAFADELEGAS